MEKLVERFSKIDNSFGNIAKKSIKTLFHHLNELKFNDIFTMWHSNFIKIHGVYDTQRKVDLRKLSDSYGIEVDSDDSLLKLIFSLETYYSIVLRLIGYKTISNNSLGETQVRSVFEGEYFERIGIYNYRCDEIYNWFLSINDFNEFISPLIHFVNKKDIVHYEIDLIKIIFENIFDGKIRHSMGEFYTPDWLVEFVLENLEITDTDSSFLDPTCGSGTFLINLISKYKDICPNIMYQIFGFDLNPLSVLAAKTNLLMALNTLENSELPYVIPIFEGDVINNDQPLKGLDAFISPNNNIKINDKRIPLPKSGITIKEIFNVYLALKNNTNQLSQNELNYFKSISSFDFSESEKDCLLSKLAFKYIKNVDYIIGNPPWINWEYMPKDYRNKHVEIWQKYGLFDLKGMEMTFIKEDISSLITYVVIDKYLKLNGKLAFVIKQTLFKSSKHAEGFRRFSLNENGIPLKVVKVYDLTKIIPFKGVNNRTAILFLEKGNKTKYPVPYYIWESDKRRTIQPNLKLSQVLKKIDIVRYLAKPSESKNLLSGWITLPEEIFTLSDKVLGKSYYRARTGVFTGGANAVYWINILGSEDNSIKIRNETKRAKRKVNECECEIEKNHIYPLLTGKELKFWNYSYSKYIICPHNAETKMNPISSDDLQKTTPLTYNYLAQFKDFLRGRRGFAGWERHILEKDFHAIQRIGEYTFQRYKVGWKYISKKFICSVIDCAQDEYLGNKVILPNEKIIYVSFDDKKEAFYLCGVLSSDLISKTIESFMVETQIGPGVLDKLKIPQFNPNDSLHLRISELCEEGHKKRKTSPYLDEINSLIKKIFV